jgi:hypothetical protein
VSNTTSAAGQIAGCSRPTGALDDELLDVLDDDEELVDDDELVVGLSSSLQDAISVSAARSTAAVRSRNMLSSSHGIAAG